MTEHQTIQRSLNQGKLFLECQSTDGFYACYEHSQQDRDVELQGMRTPRESFSSAVIADLLHATPLGDSIVKRVADYLATRERGGHFTFFEDPTLCPPDTDATALGYTVLAQIGKADQATLDKAVDTILEATDAQGRIQVWLGPLGTRPNRKDPVVTANALHLFYTAQRTDNIDVNKIWLDQILESQEYLEGTRYYHSPDTFLYFLGRFALSFPETRERYEAPLRRALLPRIAATDHVIDMAMRAILADSLGMYSAANIECANILSLQRPEGWWPADALYRGQERYFGSRALSTAFCLRALAGRCREAHRCAR